MAGTADLGNWFKKRLNDAGRAYDELNQFDGGKNWNQRTVPAKGKGAPGALGQIGHGIVRPVGQFMNTAAAQVPQSYYTGLGAIAQARGDQPGLRNAIQMQHHANSMFGDKGGLFNAGTYYNAADARRGDLKTGALKIGGGVAQTGATVMPFAKGGSVLVGFGKQPLNQVAKTAIPKLAGEGAAYGAAFSGGHQLQNNGKIDPKQLAVDTALGATFNVAAPFAIRGGRNAAVAGYKTANHARRVGFERGLENVAQNADTIHINPNMLPGAKKQLDPERVKAYANMIANGDDIKPIVVTRNKKGNVKIVDGEHRAAAFEALGLPVPSKALSTQQIKLVTQGGYIAGPGAKGFPQAKARGEVFDGVDGKPRFEVDDSGAKINPRYVSDAINTSGFDAGRIKYGATVDEILDHPTLFKDYPELKSVKVGTIRTGTGTFMQHKGEFDPKTNTVFVNKDLSPEEVKGTILHELQHAIQTKENFASGGNVKTVFSDMKKRVDELRPEFDRQRGIYNQSVKAIEKNYEPGSPEFATARHKVKQQYENNLVVKEINELYNKSAKMRLDGSDFKHYENLAGEAEARAVQARMNMKAGERYVTKEPKRPLPTDNDFQNTLPSGSRPESVRVVVKNGGNPLYHDTDSKGVLGILESGELRPSQAPFSQLAGQGKRVSTTRNFDNYSRYGKAPYRFVIDERKTGQKAKADNREEFESIFNKPVSTKAVESVAIDTTNPELISDLQNGTVARIIEAAKSKGIKVEAFEGKLLPDVQANKEIQEMTRDMFAKQFPDLAPKTAVRSTFYDSLDVPKEDLIIRNGDGKAMSIKVPKDKNVKLSKFANTTVQNSDEVSAPLKSLVKDEQVSYTPHTNEARLATADAFLKGKSNDKAYTGAIRAFDNKNANDQDVVNAIAAAKKLDASGKEDDLLKATEIYSTLSEHLTKRGQEVQAASLLSNRTPQGLYYGAVRDLKKSGIEVTPQVQKEVKNLVNEIKKFDPASDEAGFARYNLAKYVSGKVPSSLAGKVINVWRAGLLTAPTTTGGNILGNSGEMAVRKFAVNPIATAADVAMSAFTGKRSIALNGGFAGGAKQGATKLPRFMRTGYDERNALSKYDTKEINYGDGPIGSNIGKYVNGVYRTMSLADQPFWYGARNESLAGIAKVAAINKGLKGADADKFINDFLDKPPKDALELATKEAKYATFQNPTMLGGVATGIKTGAEKFGGDTGRAIADFFIPFTQVPASIATRVVQRTPIGTATEVAKQIMNVRAGRAFDQRAMAKAIGEGTFGSSVFAAGYALANSDLLTFGFPEDSKERELWEAEGKQPYSVRLGDRWYSLNYLQPFGTLLAVGGEAANSVKDGADATEAISRGVATAGQAVMNQSFLKGVSGVLDAIDNPKQYAENYVENTASSVVPNFIRSYARATDPFQRDVKGVQEGIISAIPGARLTLPKKQDMFGQDLTAKDNFANQYFNPLRPSKVKGQGDITIAELRRLHNGDQGILPTAGKKDAFGDAGELQREQVAELNRITGGAQKSEYDKLIESPQYKSLNDEQKRAALKKLNSTVYGAEKNQYGQKLGLASADDLEKDQQRYLQGSSVSFINKKKSDGSSADNVYVSDSLPTHYKKVLEDYDVMTAAEREKKFNSENDAEFKYKAAQYENQRLNGEIGEVENVKRRKELAKAELGSYVSKMTRDLYGMNKADIAYFLENHKDGQKLYNELVAYDQALVDKGLATNLKFKNGLASSKGGGGGKGKGGKNKSGGVNLPSIDTSVSSDLSNPVVTRSSYKAPNLRLQRGGRVRMGRKATIKLKAPKKLA